MSDFCYHYVTSLAMRKLAAWAFVVGERPRGFDDRPHRRLHPGMLPDVDFGRAVPVPGKPSLLRRIASFLWGGGPPVVADPSARDALRAELTAALGEHLASAYLGEEETGAPESRATGSNSGQKDWSRAA
jgi:hypothetical protein